MVGSIFNCFARAFLRKAKDPAIGFDLFSKAPGWNIKGYVNFNNNDGISYLKGGNLWQKTFENFLAKFRNFFLRISSFSNFKFPSDLNCFLRACQRKKI